MTIHLLNAALFIAILFGAILALRYAAHSVLDVIKRGKSVFDRDKDIVQLEADFRKAFESLELECQTKLDKQTSALKKVRELLLKANRSK